MSDKLLVEIAVLAGELMLVSGAEIARIEDTIGHILGKSQGRKAQNIVLSTGIFLTLDDPDGETITVIRRVPERATNLNTIYLVNQVSRSFCAGRISGVQALENLKQIKNKRQYKPWQVWISYALACGFFAVLFGGDTTDCAVAGGIGGVLGAVVFAGKRGGLNDFFINGLGAFCIGLCALCTKQWLAPDIHRDTVIVSCVMPLVPGVIFTAAMRDTLNGDYSSGVARMLEAVVTALAVAAGIGGSMALFSQWVGGGFIW